ncbi:MAG: DUF6674 family protein [Erysipelotrichaceae bacterium]
MNDNLPLYLDNIVKHYLELLNSQGLNKEGKQIEELVKYVDKMELQFDELLTEIKEIRSTLETIQNPQTKSIMRKMIDSAEVVVTKGKQEIQNIKTHIKTTIYNAVDTFKDKGKKVLVSSTEILKIKPALESVRKALFFGSNSLDKSIMKINELTSEFRRAKQSFKNIGLLMVGKQPNNNIDTLKVNGIQKVFRGMKEKSENMITKTTGVIRTVNEFQKSSVRKDLKEISSSDKKNKNIPQKTSEKTIR